MNDTFDTIKQYRKELENEIGGILQVSSFGVSQIMKQKFEAPDVKNGISALVGSMLVSMSTIKEYFGLMGTTCSMEMSVKRVFVRNLVCSFVEAAKAQNRVLEDLIILRREDLKDDLEETATTDHPVRATKRDESIISNGGLLIALQMFAAECLESIDLDEDAESMWGMAQSNLDHITQTYTLKRRDNDEEE